MHPMNLDGIWNPNIELAVDSQKRGETSSISGHRPVPQDSNGRIGLAPPCSSWSSAQASCRRSSDSRPGALPQEMEDDQEDESEKNKQKLLQKP